MPTYEYVCQACGHEFEQFQSITADALRKCPACAKMKLKRLIGTGAGVIFKGSGFYETDYRSEEYKKAQKAEQKAGESGSDEKSSGGGEKASKTEKSKAGSSGGDASSGSTAKASGDSRGSQSGEKGGASKSADTNSGRASESKTRSKSKKTNP